MKQIELKIHTVDELVVSELESSLPLDISFQRNEPSRSLTVTTILVTATAAVRLVTALIELRDKWKQANNLPSIEIRGPEGKALNLLEASEEMIKEFVDKN